MRFLRVPLSLLALFALTAQGPTLAQNARKDGAAASNPSAAKTSSDLIDVHADPPGLLYQGVPAEIPQDEDGTGLRLELLRLGTTARLRTAGC